MPSPFPGMDPYLESHWRDVHTSLIVYIRDAIQESLPAGLRARVEERVLLEGDEGIAEALVPDVRVIEHARPRQGGVTVRKGKATEPLVIDVAPERLTEGYIQILDANSGNKIVTVVEVLSPSNKRPGDNLEEYRREQREILQSDTNLVEIDLLRAGRHVVAIPRNNVPLARRLHYLVCVRRASQPKKAEVYLLPLTQPLPTIKVPLRPTDADVHLDLQALIEQCYRKGRYEVDLDYRHNPEPPLTGLDAAWADELLRGKGLRPAAARKRKRKR